MAMNYLIKYYDTGSVYILDLEDTVILSVLGGYYLNLDTDEYDSDYKFSGYKKFPRLSGRTLCLGDILYKGNHDRLLVLNTNMSMGHIKCWSILSKSVILVNSIELAKLSWRSGIEKTTISLLSESRVKSMCVN